MKIPQDPRGGTRRFFGQDPAGLNKTTPSRMILPRLLRIREWTTKLCFRKFADDPPVCLSGNEHSGEGGPETQRPDRSGFRRILIPGGEEKGDGHILVFQQKSHLARKNRHAIREVCSVHLPVVKSPIGLHPSRTPIPDGQDDFFRTLSHGPARDPGIRMFVLSSGGIAP
jgi:hypothetical protein